MAVFLPPIHTLSLHFLHPHNMTTALCNCSNFTFISWLVVTLYNIICLYSIGARQLRGIASGAGGSHVMYPWWIRALVSLHTADQPLMDNGRNHRRRGKDWQEGGGGVISGVPDVWRGEACEGHSRGQEAPYLPPCKLKHLILCLSSFLRLQLTKPCSGTWGSTLNKFQTARR